MSSNSAHIQELLIGGLRVYWIKKKSLQASSNSWENGLFVLHGRKGSALKFIEQHLDFLGLLASFSHVFLIDHRNHGERLLDQLQNEGKDKNPKHAIDMYSIQLGTAQDLGFLIEVLPLYISGLGYSSTRWGVLGFSLGGHSSLLAASQIERLTVCVSVVGCGDYSKLMESRDISIPPSLESLVAKRDPIHNCKALVSKHIILLGGEHDLLVPPWANLVFAQKLDALRAEFRQQPGSLEICNDPGAKHEFSAFMKDQAVSFLKENFGI